MPYLSAEHLKAERDDYRARADAADAENAALREKLAVAERKLAMYEAATSVEFGDHRDNHWRARKNEDREGWALIREGWALIPVDMTLDQDRGDIEVTRDEAIAKAFELSGKKLGVE